jgi:hypothetical protein
MERQGSEHVLFINTAAVAGGLTYFFAGNASYTQQLMLRE